MTFIGNCPNRKVEQKIGSYWLRFKMRKRQMNDRKADGEKVGPSGDVTRRGDTHPVEKEFQFKEFVFLFRS